MVTKSEYSVAVLGAAGGIGQSLSLLLKMNPLISDLRLYDLQGTRAWRLIVAANHDVPSARFRRRRAIGGRAQGADLVIIPAGVPRKPGMTRDDLFAISADIVCEICRGVRQRQLNGW